MYLVKTPKFIQSLFPTFNWKVSTNEKKIFLTFDDGPIEKITPWVLKVLNDFNAKATFFCVGENAEKNPEILEEIINSGHSVGNHTFNHLSGWQSENVPYFHNVRKCAQLVKSNLFRPPYGRIKPKQGQFLSRHYKIVMWDVLSGDFDSKLKPEDCLQNVIKSTTNGSIIVFHDSQKAWDRLEYVLPKVLDFFSKKGFSFQAITESNFQPQLVSYKY